MANAQQTPKDSLSREVDALLDLTLPVATAGELALLAHVLERVLEARAERAERKAAA
jgi:hypothetical protein